MLVKALATAAGALLVGLVGLLVYAQFTYSKSYLLLPDRPHALAPLVKVQQTRKSDKGSLYFVDVIERKATLAERYLPFLRRDGTLVSEQQIGPSNVNDKELSLIHI